MLERLPAERPQIADQLAIEDAPPARYHDSSCGGAARTALLSSRAIMPSAR